jgi:hypothetical protein
LIALSRTISSFSFSIFLYSVRFFGRGAFGRIFSCFLSAAIAAIDIVQMSIDALSGNSK